jgi:LysR family transcriptional regulator of abg operon
VKLDQLQHLVIIVEQGSLRGAARRLDMPQPALTRSVRALERELGCALFVRESSGMVLTPAGRRFHAHASIIVNEARRAVDAISQDSGEDEGTVSIALSIMPHVRMLPHALPIFLKRYPKVRLSIVEGLFPDVERELREGSIDFYIGAQPRIPPAAGLSSQFLMGNTRSLVVRKGHPLVNATRLKDLANAKWATTGVDHNPSDDIARLFEAHKLPPPNVMLRASSAASTMVAIANSDLVGMLPAEWEVFPALRNPLKAINIKEVLPAPSLVLIRRPDLPLTPAAEFLCDVMMRP